VLSWTDRERFPATYPMLERTFRRTDKRTFQRKEGLGTISWRLWILREWPPGPPRDRGSRARIERIS